MSTLFCLTTAKRDSHTLTCYITHTPNQPNIATVLLLSVDPLLFYISSIEGVILAFVWVHLLSDSPMMQSESELFDFGDLHSVSQDPVPTFNNLALATIGNVVLV